MSKTLRKFKFSDIGLASKVRGNMLAELKSFDINRNLLFDENQIKAALVTILKQDQNEVHYVVKNVFRYDKDGDNAITYAQFTNFSVQQHFGQMAIQRLHKKGYYTNGARRLMNLEEFQTTLNYCLDFINSKGTHIQYERLFNEVDLDRDGMISYQDYFIFLREYFGSQSQAYDNQTKKPVPRPQPPQPKPQHQKPSNFIDGNGQTPQERFAKLIYSQFKITVMERDRNKNLLLEREQFEDILKNVFKLSYNQQIQLEQKFIGGSNTSKYQDFMKAVISSYMSQISAERFFQSDSISEDQFVNTVTNKVCQFVSVKPAEHILRACFKSGSNGRSSISTGDYVKIMRNIFQNYRFDTRGLPSVRPKSERLQSIAPKSYY